MTDASRLKAQLRELEAAREQLITAADDFRDRWDELGQSPYLTEEERPLRIAEARAEASRELDGLIEAARKAEDAVKETTRALLDRHRPNAGAENTVRHLLGEGMAIGEILTRFQELGDAEGVVAARRAIQFLPEKLRAGPEFEELEHGADLALAELVPGAERADLPAALKATRESSVEPAITFAVKTIETDQSNLASARLELAYAEGSSADAGGMSDGGDGE
jgi:hypothetical protein